MILRPRFAFLALLAVLLCSTFSASVSAASAKTTTFTSGRAYTTVISLVPNADGTLEMEAIQEGSLSQIGAFTGDFSYHIIPSPTLLWATGSGTLNLASGEKLYLSVTLIELGAAHPYLVLGTLTITGGTGKYRDASGTLVITGIDNEALTDRLDIAGSITTKRSR